jgi:tyrosyl-tRNA synthetase
MIKNITLKESKLLVDIVQEIFEEEKQGKFILLPEVLFEAGFCDSKGQARRLILQGGVSIWIKDKFEKLDLIDIKLFEGEYILKVGKRKIKKVNLIFDEE